jgi:hypothetical protein
MSEEIPEIHIDHRPHHDQEKTILEDYDFEGIPEKIKFSIHRMRSLKDNTLQEIRRAPPEYVNIWVKLEYGDWICPVLFDEDGRPYIMAPAKHQETASLLDAIAEYRLRVKVYIREKRAEEILDLLKVATDFCSQCGCPLNTKGGAGDWLDYSSGGGAIADVFHCTFCEHENIRFNREFIKDHPEMELT